MVSLSGCWPATCSCLQKAAVAFCCVLLCWSDQVKQLHDLKAGCSIRDVLNARHQIHSLHEPVLEKAAVGHQQN